MQFISTLFCGLIVSGSLVFQVVVEIYIGFPIICTIDNLSGMFLVYLKVVYMFDHQVISRWSYGYFSVRSRCEIQSCSVKLPNFALQVQTVLSYWSKILFLSDLCIHIPYNLSVISRALFVCSFQLFIYLDFSQFIFFVCGILLLTTKLTPKVCCCFCQLCLIHHAQRISSYFLFSCNSVMISFFLRQGCFPMLNL